MTTLFRGLSAILLVSAVAAIAALLISDVLHQLQPTPFHRGAGAWSFILIGAAYVGLQLSDRPWQGSALKKLILGVGFDPRGFEQLLPPSPWVTVMDTLVILVFVSDLGWIIVERLKRANH